jgi:hypothetical protein
VESTSTLRGLTGPRAARRGRTVRRGALGIMLVLLGISFAGFYGPSQRTTTSSDDGYQLELTYGSVVRSGQAVPLKLRVRHAGGYDGPITVVFDQDVFDRFDFQNWYPNPSAEVGEADTVVYEFDPPDGDVLMVSLDARVAPTQWPSHHDYFVALDVDGQQTGRIDFSVWVTP